MSPVIEYVAPQESRSAATSSARRRCSFALNGRFLSQKVTGVQRYAREITRAMDDLLWAAKGEAILYAPTMEAELPSFKALKASVGGWASGHLWEQFVLPFSAKEPLLNLCNTAPAFANDQVVCIHDANVFNEPTSYARAFRSYYKLLQPWIAKRALRVTTVSHHSATQLSKHIGIPIDEIAVLPNGHEHVLRWKSEQSSLFDEEPPRRDYILLLGSLARHKNIGRVLELASALDALGLDIYVAGGGASIFSSERARLAENVRWFGRVSDDDLALLLSRALCLTFPSLTEGFGLPILEAMARGCVVVSSDRASLPEICGDAAMMADPESSEQWVRNILSVRGSALLRSELRAKGLIQSRKFSWKDSAQGYLDVLASGCVTSQSPVDVAPSSTSTSSAMVLERPQ